LAIVKSFSSYDDWIHFMGIVFSLFAVHVVFTHINRWGLCWHL